MFGIKLAPGDLKDASLSDKLMALGSALDDDMEGVQRIRDRRAKEKLARELAGALGLEDEVPALAKPDFGAGSNPARPPQAGDITVRQLPAPEKGLAAGTPLPTLAPEPQAAAPRLASRFERALPLLIKAAEQGMDVSGLMNIAKQEDYVRSLPQKDQAGARLDPSRHAGWAHDDSKTTTYEMSPDSVLVRQQGANGTPSEVYRAPSKELPMTTDRVIGAVVGKKSRGEQLSPDEQAIYDRWQAGSDGFYRERPPQRERQMTPRQQVEAQVAEYGVESLTPAQKQLWESMQRGGDDGGLYGYGAGRTPPAAPPAQRPAAAPPARPAAALPQKPPAAKPAPPPAQPRRPQAMIAPRNPAQRQKGAIYSTPKGPLRWTGTGWVQP